MDYIEADQKAHEFIINYNIMLSPVGPWTIDKKGKQVIFTSAKRFDDFCAKAYAKYFDSNIPKMVLSRLHSLLMIPYDFELHSYAFYRKTMLDSNTKGIENLDDAYANYLVRDALDHNKSRKKKSIHISGCGGCGKSTLAKILAIYVYKYDEDEIFKCATGNNSFDEYQGQKVIIFDEFRGNMPFRDFLDMTDPNADVKIGARYHNKPLQRAELLIFNSTRKVDELYSEEVNEDPVQLYRRLEWYENDRGQFMIFKRYTFEKEKKQYTVEPDIMNFRKLNDRYIKEHPRATFDDADFSDVDVKKDELPF